MNASARVRRYEIVENRKVARKLVKTADDGVDCLMVEAERRGAAIQKELRASGGVMGMLLWLTVRR
jgi:hypothetical protein